MPTDTEIATAKRAAAKAIREVAKLLVANDPDAPKPDDEDYEEWVADEIGELVVDDSSDAIVTLAYEEED